MYVGETGDLDETGKLEERFNGGARSSGRQKIESKRNIQK